MWGSFKGDSGTESERSGFVFYCQRCRNTLVADKSVTHIANCRICGAWAWGHEPAPAWRPPQREWTDFDREFLRKLKVRADG